MLQLRKPSHPGIRSRALRRREHRGSGRARDPQGQGTRSRTSSRGLLTALPAASLQHLCTHSCRPFPSSRTCPTYQHIPRALYAVRCAERATGLGKVLAAGGLRGKYNPARQAGTGSRPERGENWENQHSVTGTRRKKAQILHGMAGACVTL